MKSLGTRKRLRGRREVYEHMDAFLKLSYSDRGKWLGEAMKLADAVKAGKAGTVAARAIARGR